MSDSPKRKGEIPEKRPVQEVRAQIRDYIRNERDTILKKWMALKEALDSEDVRREQFYKRKFKEDTKSLPMNVLKFIGSLKKAVRATMRHKGGTPYSIIRSMFIYWDADKSGNIDANELYSCMKSLGVKVTLEDCREIVHYYKPSNLHAEEMDYQELLKDIQRGEPSIIAFVSQHEDEERDHNEIRFEEVGDRFVQMPPIVKKFLEAVRNYLQTTMRNQGGTPYQHIRFMFTFYDFDYSNGLDYKELMAACRRRMKLVITEEQAKAIVDYYDRKGIGQIYYEKFLEDVCQDVKPILTFTELTPRRIETAKRSLQANPFIPKPFNPPPNKVLENFKRQVTIQLSKRIRSQGGTFASWIREAFETWDRDGKGSISSLANLQGAAKRLGVDLSLEEAQVLRACYDAEGNDEMHYGHLIDDMSKMDTHFLTDPSHQPPILATMSQSVETPTQRTPPIVQTFLKTITQRLQSFVRRCKNKVDAKDLFHGTCLRFDSGGGGGGKTGKMDRSGFQQALVELRVSYDDHQVNETIKWFDNNGSGLIDYNDMSRQMFGQDVSNERLVLPRLREASAYQQSLALRTKAMESSDRLGGIAFAREMGGKGDTGNSALGGSGAGLGASSSSSALFTHPSSVAGMNPYQTVTSLASSLGHCDSFGVKSSTMERNLEVIESPAVRNARTKQKRNKILAERAKVERRLASIEDQRKKVIEEYKTRKAAKQLQATTGGNQAASSSSASVPNLLARIPKP